MSSQLRRRLNKAISECKTQASFTARCLVGKLRDTKQTNGAGYGCGCAECGGPGYRLPQPQPAATTGELEATSMEELPTTTMNGHQQRRTLTVAPTSGHCSASAVTSSSLVFATGCTRNPDDSSTRTGHFQVGANEETTLQVCEQFGADYKQHTSKQVAQDNSVTNINKRTANNQVGVHDNCCEKISDDDSNNNLNFKAKLSNSNSEQQDEQNQLYLVSEELSENETASTEASRENHKPLVPPQVLLESNCQLLDDEQLKCQLQQLQLKQQQIEQLLSVRKQREVRSELAAAATTTSALATSEKAALRVKSAQMPIKLKTRGKGQYFVRGTPTVAVAAVNLTSGGHSVLQTANWRRASGASSSGGRRRSVRSKQVRFQQIPATTINISVASSSLSATPSVTSSPQQQPHKQQQRQSQRESDHNSSCSDRENNACVKVRTVVVANGGKRKSSIMSRIKDRHSLVVKPIKRKFRYNATTTTIGNVNNSSSDTDSAQGEQQKALQDQNNSGHSSRGFHNFAFGHLRQKIFNSSKLAHLTKALIKPGSAAVYSYRARNRYSSSSAGAAAVESLSGYHSHHRHHHHSQLRQRPLRDGQLEMTRQFSFNFEDANGGANAASNFVAGSGGEHLEVSRGLKRGEDNDDNDDDDFGWGSDFDEESLDSNASHGNNSEQHNVIEIGRPSSNSRAIEDVIQDQGTSGRFKSISSCDSVSPRKTTPSSSLKTDDYHRDSNNLGQQRFSLTKLRRGAKRMVNNSSCEQQGTTEHGQEATATENANNETLMASKVVAPTSSVSQGCLDDSISQQNFQQIKNRIELLMSRRQLVANGGGCGENSTLTLTKTTTTEAAVAVKETIAQQQQQPTSGDNFKSPSEVRGNNKEGSPVVVDQFDCQSHCSDESGSSSGLDSNHSGSQDSGHSTHHSGYSSSSHDRLTSIERDERRQQRQQLSSSPAHSDGSSSGISGPSLSSSTCGQQGALVANHSMITAKKTKVVSATTTASPSTTVAVIADGRHSSEQVDEERKSRFIENRLKIDTMLEGLFKNRLAQLEPAQRSVSRIPTAVAKVASSSLVPLALLSVPVPPPPMFIANHRVASAPTSNAMPNQSVTRRAGSSPPKPNVLELQQATGQRNQLDQATRLDLLRQQREISARLKQKPRQKQRNSKCCPQSSSSAAIANANEEPQPNRGREMILELLPNNDQISCSPATTIYAGSMSSESETSNSRLAPSSASSADLNRTKPSRNSLTKQLSMICLRQSKNNNKSNNHTMMMMRQSSSNYCDAVQSSLEGAGAELTTAQPDRGKQQPRAAASLRQLVKDVIDNCEQPKKLSTLTRDLLSRCDSVSSSSDLVARGGDERDYDNEGDEARTNSRSSTVESLSQLDSLGQQPVSSTGTQIKLSAPLSQRTVSSPSLGVGSPGDGSRFRRQQAAPAPPIPGHHQLAPQTTHSYQLLYPTCHSSPKLKLNASSGGANNHHQHTEASFIVEQSYSSLGSIDGLEFTKMNSTFEGSGAYDEVSVDQHQQQWNSHTLQADARAHLKSTLSVCLRSLRDFSRFKLPNKMTVKQNLAYLDNSRNFTDDD